MASDVEALSYINLKDKEGFHVEEVGVKGKIEMHVFRVAHTKGNRFHPVKSIPSKVCILLGCPYPHPID